MKLFYDPDTASLYIDLNAKPGADAREIVEGLVVDFDADGRPVGLDIQHASRDLDRSLPIVTTPEAAAALAERDFRNTYPLETWETMTLAKGPARLRITATPARHGPNIVDFALPDVMGSILDVELDDGGRSRLYITGDTIIIDELKEIPARYPEIDIALLHLGGTRVMGILVSMDAEQGVEAMRIVAPALAIPIHYNDYDVFTSLLEDFQEEVRAAGLADRVHYLRHGETYAWVMG